MKTKKEGSEKDTKKNGKPGETGQPENNDKAEKASEPEKYIEEDKTGKAEKPDGQEEAGDAGKKERGGRSRKPFFLLTPQRVVPAILTAASAAAVMILAVQEEGADWNCALAAAIGLLAVAFVFLNISFGWILSGILALLIPPAALVALENYTHVIQDLDPMIFLLNLIFFYILYGMLTFLLGSIRRGYLFATLVPMLFGLANYFVVSFRGTPIVPWDFLSVGTAASVAGNYTFTLTWKGCYSVLAFLWMILLASKSRVRFRRKTVRIPLAAGFTALMCVFVTAIQDSDVQSYFGMDTTLFTLNVLYRNNGIAAAFLGNLRFLNIEEPDGYSVSAAQEIADRYKESGQTESGSDGSGAESEEQTEVTDGAAAVETSGETGAGVQMESSAETETGAQAESSAETGAGVQTETSGESSDDAIQPNIIVIMDEAFSDLSVWGDFETSEEVMPFFKSMQEEGIGGELYVSVKGGNTANTEFEFLTGDTMGFLPNGSVPYQQYINSDLPSLASYLSELGYGTVAIHPYYGSGWDRDEVYTYLGFDEFLDIYSFVNPLRYRGYVSDQSAFEKIIEEYEDKEEGESLFVFEVTMQNHGGYSKSTPDFDSYVKLTGVEDKTTSVLAAEKYLTLMNLTDKALQELVEYFEQQDEPTVIVMFGDHQPSDYITNVIRRICGVSEPETIEEIQQGYRVPFLIWSNYGLEHKEYSGISVNYLSSLVMEAAGLPKTDYQTYLGELMETLPVINGNTYRDADGTFYSYGTESDYTGLLNEYNILEYNHLVDTGHRISGFFGS